MHEELSRAFSLEGRVAAVTGAASGIGRDTALVFAMAGARVALIDVNREGLEVSAAAIRGLGATASVHPLDVTRRDELEAAAQDLAQAAGRLDVWVNAAGVLLRKKVLDVSEADLDRVISVNQKGVYFGMAAAGRVMCAAGRGSIINVASGAAYMPLPEYSVYGQTKAAVNMMTRDAAVEFGASGVRVNAIAPGWVETGMTVYRFLDDAGQVDPARREEVMRELAAWTPLRLTGVPRDIALAMLYLASDASRFVTGQVLNPNGGAVMP
jgi:3-oxoacyl-[acyl-carrier protein] reductase